MDIIQIIANIIAYCIVGVIMWALLPMSMKTMIKNAILVYMPTLKHKRHSTKDE